MTQAQAAAALADPAAALRELTQKWRTDPEAFVRECFRRDPEGQPVVIDPAQARILRAVAEHDRVAVRSSHGIGKTTAAAWLTMWWLATRYPALVVTMAGTWNHLKDKLWPEIKTWGREWSLRDAFEFQELGLYSNANPNAWRAEATSSDTPENVEGFHSPNLLVIIDEAKALPDEMFDAIRGALTQESRQGARPKAVVLSTPPLVKVGWYADLFGAKGERWHTIHVSGLDSTRVSRKWIEEMRDEYGEDSAIYQSKVLGDIPEASAIAVVQMKWFEDAQARTMPEDKKPTVITCDVAREGEDLTVLGKIAHARFSIVRWKAVNDTMWAAGACREAVIETAARVLVIDDTGVGGAVTDRVRELQREGKFPKNCTIIGEKFGTSATRDDRFHSRKDELWWAVRHALRDGKLALPSEKELGALQLPRGSNLRVQLTAPIYEEDSLSRIRVLDKRQGNTERTKTLPTKSPDLAHALILGATHWLRQRDIVPVMPKPRNTMEQFEKEMQEAMKARHRTGKPKLRRYPGRHW